MDVGIKILLVVLLVVAIGAAVQLFLTLGRVRLLVGKVENTLETTRQEVTEALARIETVAVSTDKVLREEVAPTLKVARDTLTNVEVTTRAVADTTVIARRIATRADQLVNTPKLLTASSSAASTMAQGSGKVVVGVITGIGAGLGAIARLVVARRQKQVESKTSGDRKNGRKQRR